MVWGSTSVVDGLGGDGGSRCYRVVWTFWDGYRNYDFYECLLPFQLDIPYRYWLSWQGGVCHLVFNCICLYGGLEQTINFLFDGQ